MGDFEQYKEKKELSKRYFVDRILVENAAVSSPLSFAAQRTSTPSPFPHEVARRPAK